MMRKYGFKQSWLNRNVDNPEQLVIVHEVEDLEKARQMYSTEEFRQCARKRALLVSHRFSSSKSRCTRRRLRTCNGG